MRSRQRLESWGPADARPTASPSTPEDRSRAACDTCLPTALLAKSTSFPDAATRVISGIVRILRTRRWLRRRFSGVGGVEGIRWWDVWRPGAARKGRHHRRRQGQRDSEKPHVPLLHRSTQSRMRSVLAALWLGWDVQRCHPDGRAPPPWPWCGCGGGLRCHRHEHAQLASASSVHPLRMFLEARRTIVLANGRNKGTKVRLDADLLVLFEAGLPCQPRSARRSAAAPGSGRAWSTFGPHAIGAERFATVASGTSFAQVAGAILRKQSRVEISEKDEAAGLRPARPTTPALTCENACQTCRLIAPAHGRRPRMAV